MTTRPTVFEIMQLGKEGTYGSAVAADTRLASLSLAPAIQSENQRFRAAGYLWDSLLVQNREWTQLPLTGVADYNELAYVFDSLFLTATPVGVTTITADTIAFVDNDPAADTITDSGAGFVAAGFAAGQTIVVTGTTLNDDTYTIDTVVAGTITLVSGDALTAEAAGTDFTIAGAAKAWTWEPAIDGVNARTSYTTEHGGDYASAEDAEVPGVVFTDFGITFSRTAIEISGAALGQKFDTAGGITAAIADAGAVPFMPKDVNHYIDTSAAGLGGTQIDALKVAYNFSGMTKPLWVLNSTYTSFKELVDSAPEGTVTIKLQADSTGMAFLGDLRDGDTLFVRTSGTSDELAEAAPATYYAFQFDTACKIENISPFSDEDGIYAIEFTCRVVIDETWAKAISWQLVNALAAV